MAGKTAYKNKWIAENKERINFIVDKGEKERIKAAATAAGTSVNGYIKEAIDEKIERDAGG